MAWQCGHLLASTASIHGLQTATQVPVSVFFAGEELKARPWVPCLPSHCHWRRQEGLWWCQWLSAGSKSASFCRGRNKLLQQWVRHLNAAPPKHEEAAVWHLCAIIPGERRRQPSVLDWLSWALPSAGTSQLPQRFYDSGVCFHGWEERKSSRYLLFAYNGVPPGAQMLLQLLTSTELTLVWYRASHFYWDSGVPLPPRCWQYQAVS